MRTIPLDTMTTSTCPIKSPDYVQHASIKGVLTDYAIDAYTLEGRYGERKRLRMLFELAQGKHGRLHKRVRAGEFGDDARQSLNSYTPTKREKNNKEFDDLVARFMQGLLE